MGTGGSLQRSFGTTRSLRWPLVIPGVFCWVPVATHIMSHRLVKTPGIGVKQTWVHSCSPWQVGMAEMGTATSSHLLPWGLSTMGYGDQRYFVFYVFHVTEVSLKQTCTKAGNVSAQLKQQVSWPATYPWALWRDLLAWVFGVWPVMLRGCPIPAAVPESWWPGK